MTRSKILNSGYSDGSELFTHAKGNFLYSQQNQQFADMAMGAGALIHGHSPIEIVSAIQKQAEDGTLFLQNNPAVQQLKEEIFKRLPSTYSYQIYCNSGSEATQRALRLARASTGKNTIVSFQGGWHGMNEWTLFEDGGRFGQSTVQPLNGIPNSITQSALQAPYQDLKAVEVLFENNSDIAAIIIEPVQGSNPQPEIAEYLRKLCALCSLHGVLVIFDEIITGFRLAKGGAVEKWGLQPDIITFGKVLGGGTPIGLVVCNEKVYESTFNSAGKSILTGGTFSANPLSASAGLASLKLLSDEKYKHLDAIGAFFRNTLNNALEMHELPLHANGVGSISRLYFTKQLINTRLERDSVEMPAAIQSNFRQRLYEKSILWPANGVLCHSLSQDETYLERIVHAVIETLSELGIK